MLGAASRATSNSIGLASPTILTYPRLTVWAWTFSMRDKFTCCWWGMGHMNPHDLVNAYMHPRPNVHGSGKLPNISQGGVLEK